MRLTRPLLLGLAGLLLAGPLSAVPPSPLRAVPAEAELVLHVREPGRLAELATTMEALAEFQKLQAPRELLDSTNARRFFQLVAHFEKKLGKKWPELLDQAAGNGIVIASKLGDNAPAVFVIEGKDAKATSDFADLALRVIEQEAARQEASVKLDQKDHHGKPTFHLGKDLNAAVRGTTIVFSNRAEALHLALDVLEGRNKKSLPDRPNYQGMDKVLPKGALATAWIDMEAVKKQPGADEVYKTPRDPFLTVVGGAFVDMLGRAPFVAAGLYSDGKEVHLAVRTPRGREGMGADRALHCPPDNGPGILPLLEPKDALFSYSFHLDLSKFWTDRNKLFGAADVKELEKNDAEAGKVLSNFRFSKFLTNAGARHRFVATTQLKTSYKRQPQQPTPAFAVVVEARDAEELNRSVEPAIRGGALILGFQQGLKMVEEKHNGCNLLSYRFPENREFPGDATDYRFTFTPTYVRVGDQFVFSSTVELARELVGLLKQEQKADRKTDPNTTARMKLFGPGAADLLAASEDQIVAQGVLGQALTIDEARKDARALIDLLRGADGATGQTQFLGNEFRYDLRLKLQK